jgi:serine-type D-Ala-D-Ala carboxypeptidase/endopeptidase (penicillin-binding protein 4)
VVLVLGISLLAGVGGYLGGYELRLHDRTRSAAVGSPTPSAVVSATLQPSSPAAAATPAEPVAALVAAALAVPLTDPRLGPHLLADVADATTGEVLLDRSSTLVAAPASTAKLAVAAAVLSVHPATERITTQVVMGATPGEIVLVGGGDPTLSAAPAADPTPYRDAARISDLAAQVKAAGVAPTSIVIDDSLFAGPAVSPSWQPDDVPTEYASAITALMADGGRDSPTAPVRSATPEIAAGDALAADLGVPPTAVTVSDVAAGNLAAEPRPAALASVQSASYGELVRQMLLDSDNVLAELLGRQVALAEHQPVSFVGAAAAIRAVLAGLGVDVGAMMTDASGLSPLDRLSPAALVGVLRLVTGDTHPALRAVADDLPVAAWDGTLAGRYTTRPADVGAGLVRAKTGTLTGVSTLAGVVPDAGGRLLVFSFAADQVAATAADTTAAEGALDTIAAALAGCTCG